MLKIVYRLLAVVLMALAVSGCVTDEPQVRSMVEPGDKLPDFSVVMNDGTTLTTALLRGRESMIVLFTTSCGDCRRELPRIGAYASVHTEVRVVCIARSESEADIAAFWQKEGLTLPYSPQPDDAIYKLFATAGVPRIYCADADLTVTAVYLEEFPL